MIKLFNLIEYYNYYEYTDLLCLLFVNLLVKCSKYPKRNTIKKNAVAVRLIYWLIVAIRSFLSRFIHIKIKRMKKI